MFKVAVRYPDLYSQDWNLKNMQAHYQGQIHLFSL